MITEPCAICALEKKFNKADHMHHLVSGSGRRKVADEKKLMIPLCVEHHQKIHEDADMIWLSKMLGQAIDERNGVAKGDSLEKVRMLFIESNGKNYLWD